MAQPEPHGPDALNDPARLAALRATQEIMEQER